MKYLIRKEIISFFHSAMGYVILSVWLLSTSLMLWIFPGDYNLFDNGFATLHPFFSLSPILLLLLVPAITMKLFAEEKKMGTFELLFFRPIHPFTIITAKFLSACLLMLIAFLPTLIYVLSIQLMSTAGIDVGELLGGYLGLICLIFTFSAIGIFTSSLTSNQLVAFLLAAVLSFVGFYGWELLASLSNDGRLHNILISLGMETHYQSLIRGVLDSYDILYFLCVTTAFLCLTALSFKFSRGLYRCYRSFYLYSLLIVSLFLLPSIVSSQLSLRLDLTADNRYTLSPQSKQLMGKLEKPLEVITYLNGELNPSFDLLRTAGIDMLTELSGYTRKGITVKEINPSIALNEEARQQNYIRMGEHGMKGISVNERDREGKLSSKVVFPWMQLIYDGDTIAIELLKKNNSASPHKVLNTSISELEYTLMEGVHLLCNKESYRIAFIEGHNELTEPYTYASTELLSKYYSVDRGEINGNPDELTPYKVLIIASPRSEFSETDKFCIDQYVMQGGSVLWLLDGIKISQTEFDASGESATLKNEVNINDLLFTYGVRINPVTVQDMNCTPIRVASSIKGAADAYTILPWYFSPLLETSDTHSITRNLSPLKSELVSTLSLVGDETIKKTILLTTSAHAHTLPVPEKISLRYVEMPADETYFNEYKLPVAALLEGNFPSAFRHRLLPKGAQEPIKGRLQSSIPSRMIVIASGSVIKNDWRGQGSTSQALPLGYEPISGEQLGNADFIVNAVNYLAGNEQWLNLRSRNHSLRLLDKQSITTDMLKWQLINVLAPLFFLLLIGIGFIIFSHPKR
ncbi:MAG: gliding motility-associated ABC transporter substrate-binding protein GldG [Bacteroides sp.]